jgi:hypothetical protein
MPAVMSKHPAEWQHKEQGEEQQVAAGDQKERGGDQ